MTKTAERSISEDAVRRATGKDWAQWFALLDGAKANQLSHAKIANHLLDKHEISPWWSQMVTVMYERSRGLRKKYETADGFSVSVTMTLPVPVDRLYSFWQDPSLRKRWISDKIVVRKSNPRKSARFILHEKSGKQLVEIAFYPNGPSKTRLSIQHSKLASSSQVEKMRAHWKRALARLREQSTG